jgi:hypothetical protein
MFVRLIARAANKNATPISKRAAHKTFAILIHFFSQFSLFESAINPIAILIFDAVILARCARIKVNKVERLVSA